MMTTIGGLVRIAGVVVPANPGEFKPSEHIRPGQTYKVVGEKLAESLKGQCLLHMTAEPVTFFRSDEPERGELPPEVLARTSNRLSWWSLHRCLSLPTDELKAMLPTGTQLGCLVGLLSGSRVVRVQIDWEGGHNIGFRPLHQPDWTWNAGTVFAAAGRNL